MDAFTTQGRPPDGAEITWLGFCAAARPEVVPRLIHWVRRDDPALLAAGLVQRLEGRLPEPIVTTSPPLDRAVIIGVPVFVTVNNWQPELSVSETLAGTSVTLTARPELSYDPAEPGATSVRCVGGGTPYRPEGPDLSSQATSPGACTYAYRHRTEAPGRPTRWPATTTVTWSLTWRANDGSSGTLPAVVRRVSTPRTVHEVQALLTRQP